MSFFKSTLLSFSLVFMVGCASLMEKIQSENAGGRKVFQIEKLWVRSSLDKENSAYRKINRSSPVIVGDLLIQGNALDGIGAYELESGKLRWKFPILNGVESKITQFKNSIYVPALDGKFYSLDVQTGRLNWEFQARAENLGEPAFDADGGRVMFLSGNNTLYVLEAESGKQIWTYNRQDTSVFSIRGGGKPVIKEGRIYLGFSDGALVALNSETGNVLWDLQLNKNKRFRDIDATPVIDQDRIYISGFDDRLYCISTSKGEILWKIDLGSYSGPILNNDLIFYPTTQSELVAIKKSNGDILWRYSIPGGGIATSPVIYKNLLIFGESAGPIRFLNFNDGKLVGSFEPGRGVMATPTLDESKARLYFISGEANIYSLGFSWKPMNQIQTIR